MKLRIAFFGTPAFSVPILESIAKEHTIVTVVSQPDKPTGKGGHVTPSAVSQYARDHTLPLITPEKIKDESFRQHFQSLTIDLIVVVAYGKILPQWVLDVPRLGAINIHASLLPRYRGASPILASILHGDSETGLSYIIMNSKMDEGDVIIYTKIAIDPHDTTESLSINLSHTASREINEVLSKYAAGVLTPEPQNHDQATYCQMLHKDDGRIDFTRPPLHLERLVRAYYPWPGVWGLFRGKRVKLLPGNRVQMEGKKTTTLQEFKHGYPDFPLLAD